MLWLFCRWDLTRLGHALDAWVALDEPTLKLSDLSAKEWKNLVELLAQLRLLDVAEKAGQQRLS